MKTAKTLCIIGSALLLVMAAFHGSGYAFVTEAILESNAEDFLKQIVPALFVHPSIHLVGLATFGILALFLKQATGRVLTLLAILVVADAALAFYLGAVPPGVMLLAAASCFAVAGYLYSGRSGVAT